MAISVTLQLEWWDRLSRRIEGVDTMLSNLQPFFRDTVDLLKKKSDEVFSTKWQRLLWWRWAWLSSSTTKARVNRRWYYRRQPNNPSVLRWTGNLQDNVTKKSTKDYGQLIFNAPYAWYHHVGRWQRRRKLVELDPKTNAEIIRILQTYIIKEFGTKSFR